MHGRRLPLPELERAMTRPPFIHVVCIEGYTIPLSYCGLCIGAVVDRAQVHQVFTVEEVADMRHTVYDSCTCCGYRFVVRTVARGNRG